MKKLILILFLSVFISIPILAKQKLVVCHNIPATEENAGRILDWCKNVTCRVCTDMSVPGVTIHTTECWSNC